ncbi:MAG: pilus assembly protein [Rhizobiaceae bacterium]|nr:pilus assembly protein [Rhizobiaceae bacterium]
MTFRRLGRLFGRFVSNKSGNLAVYSALAMIPILGGVSMAVEYSNGLRQESKLQNLLDAAVLAGARADAEQVKVAEDHFAGSLQWDPERPNPPVAKFVLGTGKLSGSVTGTFDLGFGSGVLGSKIKIGVKSEAVFKTPMAAGPCVTVLANAGQALLINSGAKVTAKTCEIHVQSQQNPAFIMNAGSTLDISKLCVKGTQYIKNGGTISKLETGCATAADPYKGVLAEPTVPSTCTTSGAKDGTTHSLNPGAHCNVNFNGSPTITFKPGLHIIKGSLNINANSTVIAEGVTFYFPDTDSKIQGNGGLTITATAPTSGTYKDILMFEKTSDAANNANKRQFVFNGSKGEKLEGIIYLPNRDVTYNSTTNVSGSKINLIVNTLIMNSANWTFEGFAGGGTGGVKTVYLSK